MNRLFFQPPQAGMSMAAAAAKSLGGTKPDEVFEVMGGKVEVYHMIFVFVDNKNY